MNPQDFWNGRYRDESYAYGTLPNEFIAQSIQELTPGKIYFPAEGEGRNAVYAATKGWKVWAADQSEEGKKKAMQLAKNHNVEIHYHVGNAMHYTCPEPLDAVGLCYFHTPETVLAPMYSYIFGQIKQGGTVLLEGFSEKNLGLGSGGPQDLSRLFTEAKIKTLLSGFQNIKVWEECVQLNEGQYHQGTAWVIRAIAEK
jgi:hypothetical protein